jgi:hypothetical protein
MFDEQRLGTWRIRSPFLFPELAAPGTVAGGPESDKRYPNILIAEDTSRENSGHEVVFQRDSLLTGVASDGCWSLDIPGRVRFTVRQGKEILYRVHSARAVNELDLRWWVLGPVMAACCAQRGVVALRGSAVRRGGSVIVLCGEPGVGKSALATALMELGYALISDGLVLLTVIDGEVEAISTYPWLHLWKRAAFSLDLETDEEARVCSFAAKYRFRYQPPFEKGLATRVSQIVMVQRSGGGSDQSTMRALRTARATALVQRSYAINIHFADGVWRAAGIIASCVPVRRLAVSDERQAAMLISDSAA